MYSITSFTPAESRRIGGFLPRQLRAPRREPVQNWRKVLWKNKDSRHEDHPQSQDYRGVSEALERMSE